MGIPKPVTPQLFKLFSSLEPENLLKFFPNDCPRIIGMYRRLHNFDLSY